MAETLKHVPLHIAIEDTDALHVGGDEGGQRDEEMRRILHVAVENGNKDVVSDYTRGGEVKTTIGAHEDSAIEEDAGRPIGGAKDGGGDEETRGISHVVYGAGNDAQGGLKFYTPDLCMVARHGTPVHCEKVPCKALFLGIPGKMRMMLPT